MDESRRRGGSWQPRRLVDSSRFVSRRKTSPSPIPEVSQTDHAEGTRPEPQQEHTEARTEKSRIIEWSSPGVCLDCGNLSRTYKTYLPIRYHKCRVCGLKYRSRQRNYSPEAVETYRQRRRLKAGR